MQYEYASSELANMLSPPSIEGRQTPFVKVTRNLWILFDSSLNLDDLQPQFPKMPSFTSGLLGNSVPSSQMRTWSQ